MNEKVRIVEGKIIETPKPNEIYLALFDQGSGWQISGVMYHTPDEVAVNLAAFNPKQIVIVKVEIPCREPDEQEEAEKSEVMRAIDKCGPNWGQPDNYHNEAEDEGKPELIGIKVSPNGVEDIRIETTELEEDTPIKRTIEERMSRVEVASSKYFLDMRGWFDSIEDIDEYRKRNPGANGEVYTLSGYLVNEDATRAEEDKVDSTSPDGKAGKEFGKALQETTDRAIVEAVEGPPRPNPVAHVEVETLEDEIIKNENIVSMTLREFICLPRHSEYILAKLQFKVGDRVRFSNRQEELIQKLGVGEISKVPFLEVEKVGETGIASISFTSRIADISEEDK